MTTRIKCRGDVCAAVLQPGDHVAREALLGPLIHHGIVDVDGRVIHATPDAPGVVSDDLETFAAGREIEVIGRAASPDEAAQVAARARAQIGAPFDIFQNNCEHVAFAARGRRASPTLERLLRRLQGR